MAKKLKPTLLTALLITGFAGAVIVRVLIGNHSGSTVAQSALAGIAFAACLVMLSCANIPKTRLSRKIVAMGIAGGLVLCVPSVIAMIWGADSHRPGGNYWQWALVVSIVAFAEELFLRGTLFGVLLRWKGEVVAVVVTSLLFALLHVPLYGWHVVPLDVAVGVWFSVLRLVSGSYLTSAFAHITADLLGWWLR
jgi:membrane protease YdiL (CAAX protease family)